MHIGTIAQLGERGAENDSEDPCGSAGRGNVDAAMMDAPRQRVRLGVPRARGAPDVDALRSARAWRHCSMKWGTLVPSLAPIASSPLTGKRAQYS